MMSKREALAMATSRTAGVIILPGCMISPALVLACGLAMAASLPFWPSRN